jgi:hypothetical protein
MKHHTSEQLVFSSICGKKVTAVFDDHRVTSDAGVLVLREIEQRIKLIDALTDAIVDSRHPSYVRHEMWEMLAQRVFPWPRAGRSLWGTTTATIVTPSKETRR